MGQYSIGANTLSGLRLIDMLKLLSLGEIWDFSAIMLRHRLETRMDIGFLKFVRMAF